MIVKMAARAVKGQICNGKIIMITILLYMLFDTDLKLLNNVQKHWVNQ